ncbi:GntR family transcriptional regulator [Actinokineospora sp. HUAS TT18]|uniref:GntR family transcriptional regulator n=1 Tax=Actinokineospora sp. HUAS TT18 TaxID=3447451 RepID=UPI003F520A47
MSSRPNGAATALAPIVRDSVRARTSDRVYDELVHAIRDLRMRPGATLSETELSAQLGVSRTPVREAISRLVTDGLVTVVPQVGTNVARISIEDVRQAQFVREHLEMAAYSLACKLPVRDTAPMRALLAEQERAHSRGDTDAFFAADEAFHEQIFEMAGYRGAWHAMQPVKLQLDRLRRSSLPEPRTVADLIAEHTAITDALEAGDTRRGGAVVRAHARRVLKYGPDLRRAHPDMFTD